MMTTRSEITSEYKETLSDLTCDSSTEVVPETEVVPNTEIETNVPDSERTRNTNCIGNARGNTKCTS